jgi:hypothetical protein
MLSRNRIDEPERADHRTLDSRLPKYGWIAT